MIVPNQIFHNDLVRDGSHDKKNSLARTDHEGHNLMSYESRRCSFLAAIYGCGSLRVRAGAALVVCWLPAGLGWPDLVVAAAVMSIFRLGFGLGSLLAAWALFAYLGIFRPIVVYLSCMCLIWAF